METDPPSLIGRAREAFGKRIGGFSVDAPKTAPPDPAPVLMWLAGAGYRPKETARRKGLVPLAKGAEEAADRLLATAPPDDPLLAARLRADLLASLNREAQDDPRVREIFEVDPVLVADPRTGWLVTESMVEARFALFDALDTLLDRPRSDEAARLEMRRTLVAAFTDLTPESQREWCYSEWRLEQGVLLLEERPPSDLMVLAETLRPVHVRRGPWAAMRLFGIAAAMHDVRGGHVVPVVDLLGLRGE